MASPFEFMVDFLHECTKIPTIIYGLGKWGWRRTRIAVGQRNEESDWSSVSSGDESSQDEDESSDDEPSFLDDNDPPEGVNEESQESDEDSDSYLQTSLFDTENPNPATSGN
eukprot:c22284_g1_i1.p1 GENE.c22284_g1_i1~~c22284_g1_i1.p1  ORF type:complete len:112 (+),score=21.36 c22284_g1_i1:65-400(+)